MNNDIFKELNYLGKIFKKPIYTIQNKQYIMYVK